LLSARWLMT
ncbi:pantoate--beta-alanine ligase, partial [Vibrio parahaemolyticus V-223/04]